MKNLDRNEETPVILKTQELCQTILDQPGYERMRKTILKFMSDEKTRGQYERLCSLQEALHRKRAQDELVSQEEYDQFEKEEHLFIANPVAQEFIRVQEEMQKIEATILNHVRKTLELGRLPTGDDMDEDGGCACGGSCGGH